MMLEKDNSSSCDGCRKWTYRCTSVALGAVIIGLSLPALSAGSSPEGLNFGKGMLQNGAFSTGGSTKDCTVDYNFGLVNFKATNFCTGKEVDATYYSDDCSSVFPGSDLCKTCEHAGNAVVTLGTFGLIASFLAFGAIVAKYFFGKEEEKTWKLTAFISVAVCSIFTLICWTVWLDPCSYEIVDFLNAAPEGFDKADFNLGDAWGLYFFAWIFSLPLLVMEGVPVFLSSSSKTLGGGVEEVKVSDSSDQHLVNGHQRDEVFSVSESKDADSYQA
mmetsp:Transcript_29313/g.40764  ORF Transcript_29313/g.40764 Transcript_29313/m.40764 type:complete len:274 (+) Transcript_29313:96-917(+)|eukprot:CAMPEP_0184477990 /NCGR_PEP_ID=MMETSP0113_2-20130426/117_1 /TAXON_ID=91329 /ORGANISM="Norrisiella sphaerica, Strain BC52" /LENGTH=273 /DNA_ID=CAMNT_0026855613 /DNA_START=96 /DNA_END=917 /DNA_ORIENTATION=+